MQNRAESNPGILRIRRVVWVVQGVMGFTMGLYIFTWGPLFYEKLSSVSNPNLGMTLTAVLISLLSVLRTILEVPTGAVADSVGRKMSVVWSLSARTLYFALLALVPFCNSTGAIMTVGVLSVISFAFAYTLYSGSFTAWCVDSLRTIDPEMGYERLLSKAYTVNFLSQVFGGVFAVILFLRHLSFVGFLLGGVVSVFCVAFCLAEMDDERDLHYVKIKASDLSSVSRRMGEIFGTGLQVFLRSRAIFFLVLIFSAYMFVINMVDYMWPVSLRNRIAPDLQPKYWVAMVVGTLMVSALGSQLLSWVSKRSSRNAFRADNDSLRRLLVGTCAITAMAVLTLSLMARMGFEPFWYFVTTVMIVQFAYGAVTPTFETLVNNLIPPQYAQERATIMSLGSMSRSLLILLLAIPTCGSEGSKTVLGWAIPSGILLTFALVGNFYLGPRPKAPVTPTTLAPVKY